MNQLITEGHTSEVIRPDPINDLIASFFSSRAKTTIKAYQQDLQGFHKFLKVNSVNEAARALLSGTNAQANFVTMKYKAYLIDEAKLAPATVNRRLAALRSLVHLARTLGFVSWDLEIENQQHTPYRDTKGIGTEGIKKIFQYLESKQDTKSIRDNAILRLLFDLGLRRQEALNIDLEDLNLRDATVAILGKGRTEKETLSLPSPTVEAIEKWLAIRGATCDGPLFLRLDKAKDGSNRRLTGTGLYSIIRELGARVGFKMTVHGVRHSAISECCKIIAEHKLGIETVLKFSRHKSLNTALIYFDHLENKQGQLADLVASKATI